MDNEKLNNEEVVENEVVTEEDVEEPTEVAEEIEETADDTESSEEVVEDTEAVVEQSENAEGVCEPTKKCNAGLIGLIAGGVIVIAALVAYMLFYFGVINPWEKGYVDTTGVTLQELADKSGYSLSEYKKVNGLPKMMPKSTFENAVNNSVKLKYIISKGDKTIEEWREHYGWDESVTEETTIGDAMAKTKLSVIIGGDDYVDIIKGIYGLPDDVTGDTLYGEVRTLIDQKTVEMKKEQEEKTDDEKQENADAPSDAENESNNEQENEKTEDAE